MVTLNAIDKQEGEIKAEARELNEALPVYYHQVEAALKQLPPAFDAKRQLFLSKLSSLKSLKLEDALRDPSKAKALSDGVNDFYQAIYALLLNLEQDLKHKKVELNREEWSIFVKNTNKTLMSLEHFQYMLESYDFLLSEGPSSWVNYLFVNKKGYPLTSFSTNFISIEFLEKNKEKNDS